MKKIVTIFIFLAGFSAAFHITSVDAGEIKLIRDPANIDRDLRDITFFLGIEYLKIDFEGEGLDGKTYRLTAKEIWDGEIKDTSTVFNSAEIPAPHLQRVTGDTFQIRIVSELSEENTLRMNFNFPGLTVKREYDAIQSDDYSLRYASMQPETKLSPGESFYLLTYMLPYEEDGIKHYCSVEASGSDVLLWGEEFGIEHYLVFEMVFEEM